MSALPLPLTLTLALALASAAAGGSAPRGDAVAVPGFGAVQVLGAAGGAGRAVVLLSDARGPDAATRALAERLADGAALVAIVDSRAYLASRPAGRCAYPAGDLEALAQRVQKVLGLAAYARPVLVGHREGAALAWAAISQAPAGTFAGAVFVSPCPGRPLPLRLCPGAGPPPRRLAGGELPALVAPPARVEIVGAARADACPGSSASALAAALEAGYTEVPGVGHGLDAVALEAIGAAAARAAAAPGVEAPPPPPAVADLPVIEVPSREAGPRMALLLTGDGGWVAADKGLAAALAARGVSVVGLDSLRYFWRRRTPAEATRDVARLLAHYRAAWRRPEVLLVGYSRGADVAPVIAGRLPPEEAAHLKLVAMLGPSTFAELEVHAVDLFTSRRRPGAIPTEEAVRSTGGRVPMLCVHGEEERDSLCPHLADLAWVRVLLRPGGHRIRGDYDALARAVLDAAP